MNKNKLIISLQGRSCTGKSTVGDSIKEKYLGIYTIDYDRVKRQLSGYDHKVDAADMRDMSLGFFEVACKSGKPILLLVPPFHDEAQFLQYKDIADKFGYIFYFVDLTASREVLIARYRERLQNVEKLGKAAIKTEEEYLKTLETPYFRPTHTITFDTSNGGSEEIADKILGAIEADR